MYKLKHLDLSQNLLKQVVTVNLIISIPHMYQTLRHLSIANNQI